MGHRAASGRLALPASPSAVADLLRVALRKMDPQPLSATVFGSACRGDADGRSDVDIAVVRPKGVRDALIPHRRPEREWREAVLRLEEAWGHVAVPSLDVVEGGLTRVREALRSPGSIWAGAAVRGTCVVGAPLVSLAAGPVRYDPEAARARRVANALGFAGDRLGMDVVAEGIKGLSAEVTFVVLWPGARFAADALLGAYCGGRAQRNRPEAAAEALAPLVGRKDARRYARLAAMASALDEDPFSVAVRRRDVDDALRLGRCLYDRAMALSSDEQARAKRSMGTQSVLPASRTAASP